jgi:hypothetical protein
MCSYGIPKSNANTSASGNTEEIIPMKITFDDRYDLDSVLPIATALNAWAKAEAIKCA